MICKKLKLEKESLVICDSNICVYRTLETIKPKIYNEDLEKTKKLIEEITNNNFKCKIIVTDIAYSEIKDNEILFGCVNEFCVKKLHYRYGDFRTIKIFNQAKKSINKFIDRRLLDEESKNKIKNYKTYLESINQFYLKFPKRLQEITDNKIKFVKPFDKQRKLQQRPNNLPEENDRLILCQAIELKKQQNNPVCIFSNDSDFLEFKEEIKQEFEINILSLDDNIINE